MFKQVTFEKPCPDVMILDTSTKRLLSLQAVLVTASGWSFYVFQGLAEAQSAFFGGCIVMFNVWFTHRRLNSLLTIKDIPPEHDVQMLYATAILRFIYTVVFFIVGLGILQLSPIPLLITFALAQISYFLSGLLETLKNQRSS